MNVMKTLLSIILAVVLSYSFSFAQQKGSERKEAAEKKADEERMRSMGGYRTNNELKDNKGEIQPVETNDEKEFASGESDTTQSEESDVPAVMQRSTSGSGSPSVLSDNNGYGRDGTGNVQRAKPNMAGAEVPEDLNLDNNTEQSEEVDGSVNIRRDEEAPSRITSPGRETAGQEKKETANKKSDDDHKKSSRSKAKRKKDRNRDR